MSQAPFPGLTSLTPSISYLRQPESPKADHGISLIVLCTWMSAGRRPIAKYIAAHRVLYPTADILVLESRIDIAFFWSESQRMKALAPALEVVLQHVNDGKVLLHVFSNGGAQCACLLTLSLPESVRRQVWKAVVFDSCPGATTYWASIHAMKLSFLPKSSAVLRVAAVPFIHLLLWFIMVRSACGWEDIVMKARRRLNEEGVFGRGVPRLYLFSKEDGLVGWRDVKAHAEAAREKGWEIVEEREFEGSAHCAHAMKFKKEYWETLGAFVKGALLYDMSGLDG